MINEQIRDREIRLIGQNGEQLGIMSARDAYLKAQEAGLDLVKIAPTAKPPVCKIIDYGKYRYEPVSYTHLVKGEKHFPVFEGDVVFKPLTKSKPLSTPLFAYAEVFWSWVIDAYFMPAPQYQLAFCEGYEAEVEKYYDYGTVSPMIYGEGEHLLNLLEFFRKYPDDKVHIDDYVNYCQMFYDYTEILESDYFQTCLLYTSRCV